jgi:hypothetical protein
MNTTIVTLSYFSPLFNELPNNTSQRHFSNVYETLNNKPFFLLFFFPHDTRLGIMTKKKVHQFLHHPTPRGLFSF